MMKILMNFTENFHRVLLKLGNFSTTKTKIYFVAKCHYYLKYSYIY